MLTLNNKIKNGRTELVTDAQMVGNYAYDSSKDRLRRLTANTNGALNVDVHGGATGSGDLKCRTDIADPATSTFVKCNADGTLEMTAELSSAGLAKAVTQTDGNQIVKIQGVDSNTLAQRDCKQNANGDLRTQLIGNDGNDGAGTMRIVKTDANGELLVNLGSSTTQNVNCLGNTVGDGSGTATHLKTASDGSLHIISENFDSMLIKGVETGTTTQRDCKQNANGDLRVQLIANDGNDGAGTMRIVKCDANGVLDSSGGGGGSASSTQSSANANSSSGVLKVYGSDNSTAFIDTNGGNKFMVTIQCVASSAGQFAVEWSDTSSFTEFFVCNGFTPLGADISPKSLTTGVQRVDASTVTNQAIIQFETIPARYARISAFQSVGTVEYVVKTYISP